MNPMLFCSQERKEIKMAEAVLDLTTILDRLAATSRRPPYAMMVLNILSEAADHRGQAGPFVTRGGETLHVRPWLGETLARMAERHPSWRSEEHTTDLQYSMRISNAVLLTKNKI